MPNLGAPELLIVLLIVIVLFGVGRIGKVGGELGKGIREFRTGLRGDETATPQEEVPPKDPPAAS
jgi:sec-independent protein translocase protein TatA